MMDQAHLGYTYWQQPLRNAMPAVQEIQVPPAGEMGVSIEGSEASWPNDPSGPTVLPALSVFDRQSRYVEVFNRGQQPFDFTVETSNPWLVVDTPRGTVERDRRILVSARWDDVPVGTERASLAIVGAGGTRVPVTVPIVNPASPRPEDLDGFVEANGFVSIEAEHWTRAVAPAGREWKIIPNHGRTLSGVTAWPVTPDASLTASDGMRLEYRMYLFTAGKVGVSLHLAPTQKLQPGDGFRVGVSLDEAAPQIVNLHADQSNAAWERSVGDGVTVVASQHAVAAPGYHTLKIWALDPAVVIQKIVVSTGRPRPSYLGPPESARGKR
jgi:hypothetical protein